jgi:large repetitive protein
VVDNLGFGSNLFTWTVDNPVCDMMDTDTLEVYRADISPIASGDFFTILSGTSQSISPTQNDSLVYLPSVRIEILPSTLPQGVELEVDSITQTVQVITPALVSNVIDILYQVCNSVCADKCDTASVRMIVREKEFVNGGTTIISPNNDTKNETLFFDYLDKYPENSLVIFNRWGQQVYYASPYKNESWNGTYNGNPLPAGTYYYILNLLDEDERVWGDVLILR